MADEFGHSRAGVAASHIAHGACGGKRVVALLEQLASLLQLGLGVTGDGPVLDPAAVHQVGEARLADQAHVVPAVGQGGGEARHGLDIPA